MVDRHTHKWTEKAFNSLTRLKQPQNYFTKDVQTDRRTNGGTDSQTSGQQHLENTARQTDPPTQQFM